jgi:hypothetical protein
VHVIIHDHPRKTHTEWGLKVQCDYNDMVVGQRRLLVKVAHISPSGAEFLLLFVFFNLGPGAGGHKDEKQS